jgi:hypothetical protein
MITCMPAVLDKWLMVHLRWFFFRSKLTCSSREEKPSRVGGPCSNALSAKLQIQRQTALTNPRRMISSGWERMTTIGNVVSLVLSYIKLQVACYAYLRQLVLYQLLMLAHCIWSHANLVKKTLAGRPNRPPICNLLMESFLWTHS